LTAKKSGWLFGIDYMVGNWSDYRFLWATDPNVQDKWELRAGVQLKPVPKSNYFSNVSYRAGTFFGTDYVHLMKSSRYMEFPSVWTAGLQLQSSKRGPGNADQSRSGIYQARKQ
jgi:hypothetical protein